jgi:hypothetical protein
MSRTLRLALAAAATAGIVSALPANASPCAAGERVTGRTDVGYICTNLKTGAERIVPFGT